MTNYETNKGNNYITGDDVSGWDRMGSDLDKTLSDILDADDSVRAERAEQQAKDDKVRADIDRACRGLFKRDLGIELEDGHALDMIEMIMFVAARQLNEDEEQPNPFTVDDIYQYVDQIAVIDLEHIATVEDIWDAVVGNAAMTIELMNKPA